jgi:SAM-dependent methyltransferase
MRRVRSSWAGKKVYDWTNYLVPARPSPPELRIVEEYLRRLNDVIQTVRVAILGSTVEFRSLCHRYRAEVTVVEFSRRHYQVLSRQPMRFMGKETLREEDWRTMHTRTKYDLILGDLVLNVVAHDDITRILRNLGRSLADGGYCLLRTWVRTGDKKYDIRAVVAQHRQRTPRINFYTACLLPLHMCDYDFKNDSADYPAMTANLLAAYRAGLVKRDEYQYCVDRWKFEGSAFSIPRKSAVERLKRRYFRIAAIRYGTDCFRRWAPLYILRKKPRTSRRMARHITERSR